MGRLGKPLFDESIEAWKCGPVVPEINYSFKTGSNYARTGIIHGGYDRSVFNSQELELLFDVFDVYRDKSTNWMIRETHRPDGPWTIRGVLGENKIILPSEMKEYFSREPLPRAFHNKMSKLKTIGYHDSEGHLILPKEWDD